MIEIPDKDEIERHYAAMRGGDDQLSYTETGTWLSLLKSNKPTQP